jgi:hypothetical protein
MKRRQAGTKNNEIHMSHSDTKDNENNPPGPPLEKGDTGGFSGENVIPAPCVIPAKAGIHKLKPWIPCQARNDR